MRVPFKIHIPFFKTKNSRLVFVFEKRFTTKETIISLGSACHPAHLMESMNFRKKSLPFDWLLTDSISGMEYVYDNIVNKFNYFASELQKDKSGNVYASRYPNSCFFHHPDILTNKKTLQMFNRRCERFLHLLKNERCVFLYCVTGASLSNNNSVNELKTSIAKFIQIVKPEDKLLIYINSEESLDENQQYYLALQEELNKIKGVTTARFLLETKKYGLWGYENNYPDLLKNLGVEFRLSIPKIGIKKISLRP